MKKCMHFQTLSHPTHWGKSSTVPVLKIRLSEWINDLNSSEKKMPQKSEIKFRLLSKALTFLLYILVKIYHQMGLKKKQFSCGSYLSKGPTRSKHLSVYQIFNPIMEIIIIRFKKNCKTEWWQRKDSLCYEIKKLIGP